MTARVLALNRPAPVSDAADGRYRAAEAPLQ